ncbi:MAG: 16S rRNA (guanine(527)-N(7))-methyltransferase RsmG [Clostridiales bacterium]|nr:16S rRNA (guanine(527)-N(7))-methyltransferase RsmG [Clostridiales bacterium]
MARQIHPLIARDEFTTLYKICAETALGSDSVFTSEEFASFAYGIYASLIEASAHFNLTAITEPSAVTERHIVDSLIPLKLMIEHGLISPNGEYTLTDIGAGAGFPSLPLAAACTAAEKVGGLPQLQIHAVDSTAKKIKYISNTAVKLGIKNISATVGRAEVLAHTKLRENCDIVTARAVSAMPTLIELAAPFVKVGGVFAAMKSHADDEVKAAAGAAAKLGLSEAQIIRYSLPSGDERSLVLYRKIKKTPTEYPRIYSKITKEPL